MAVATLLPMFTLAQTPPVTASSTQMNFGQQKVGTTATPISFSPSGNAVAAGDFNGDGHLDLAVTDGGPSGVNVLLGNGDGTFQPATFYGAGGGNTDFVAVGDLNGDGKLDLVTANPNIFGFSVFLGNGDGTFQQAQNYTVGYPTIDVSVADFNQDGFADIATGSAFFLNTYLGSATGALSFADIHAFSGPWVSRIAIADFNQDGHPDLAVAHGSDAIILLGSGLGNFTPATTVTTGALAVAAADMNGDGKPDLITDGAVYLGNGDGTFQPAIPFGSGWYPISLGVADFNGDGKRDVIVANSYSSISVLLGNGDGTLQPPANYGGGAGTIATGDFNGDAKTDFATPDRIVLGNGDGTFQSAQSVVLFAQTSDPLSVAGAPIVGPNASDFSLVSSFCPNAYICWYGVAFTPTATGTRSAQLQLSFSGYSTPITVDLTGTGVPVDTTPPAIQCGAPNGQWHGSDVSIPCTASDSGSGLANASDANFSLSTSVAAGTETASASTGSYQVCDKAGNCATAGPISGNKVDKKSPTISITTPSATSYLLNQNVLAQYQCIDGGSGVASCTGSVANNAAINTGAVGANTFTVTAADAVGNASSTSVGYKVVYASGGTCYGAAGHQILQPINADGTSVWKQGSTVPAKFRVCDASGTSVGIPGVVSSFRLTNIISGTVTAVDETVVSTTPDTAFRWDSTNQQWIFNISTKSLAAGSTYVYTITLNDGTTIVFQYGLR